MKVFALYIADDRYEVPTLKLEVHADEAAVRTRAQALLDASRHHLGVEVCVDNMLLFGLGTRADENVGQPCPGKGTDGAINVVQSVRECRH